MNQTTRKWGKVETYGGKLVENITQAIARDVLAQAMLRISEYGYNIVMHVHDEVVIEVPEASAEKALQHLYTLMSVGFEWSVGLPLEVDGYLTPFYKK